MHATAKTYTVTRLCCRSGMCFECRAVGNLKRRKRIVHADNLTQDRAKAHANGWADYEPKIEENVR